MTAREFESKYGWDKDTVLAIDQIVRTTRDGAKHIIFGMVSKTGFFDGDLHIRVMDRSGLTPKQVAMSKIFPDRASQIDAYDDLIRHYGLPYCCKEHRDELDPEEEDGDFFDEKMDKVGDFFEDEDEDDWDIDDWDL